MADFATWSHANLVKFAQENEAERNALLAASIRKANEHADALRRLKALVDDYKAKGEMFCFVPDRHEAYRQAKDAFK